MERYAVATYNVHGFRGMDGQLRPDRTAEVIRELDADVVGLQEVACAPRLPHANRADRTDQTDRTHRNDRNAVCGADPLETLDALARRTGHTAVTGLNMASRRSPCCNALLLRETVLPVRHVETLDLSRPGREPREVVTALAGPAESPLRLAVLHVGLGLDERLWQVAQMAGVLKGWGNRRAVVLGDFNEWNPFSRTAHRLQTDLGAPWQGATFPTMWRLGPWRLPGLGPLLPLDRLGVTPDFRLVEARPHRSPLARLASDHFPLRGVVEAAVNQP